MKQEMKKEQRDMEWVIENLEREKEEQSQRFEDQLETERENQ